MTKFILAISGGVDSRVLLHLTATNYNNFCKQNFQNAIWPNDFIVAHFDHGIRKIESKNDAKFVQNLAKKYNAKFILGTGNLPSNSSENLAREKRYEFLFNIENNAKIVTAHHRDDLLETILINLIRGTKWRGLTPMNNARILRPLMNLSKFEIVNFALENDLNWVEDESNFSANYFRNRVRNFLLQISENDKIKLLKTYEKQRKLYNEIQPEITKIINEMQKQKYLKCENNKVEISRYFLIMMNEKSAMEILRYATKSKLTQPELAQIWLFAKIAAAKKQLNFCEIKIRAEKRAIIIDIKD